MRIPPKPPSIDRIIADSRGGLARMMKGKPTLEDGRYLPWHELRYRSRPADLSPDEHWAMTRLARKFAAISVTELATHYALPFSYVPLPQIQRALHKLDRANVQQEIIAALGNEDAKAEYRARQLIEEAISSSQVEGAKPTTRELARQLVRENRTPASRDERMILNNWTAMVRMLRIHDDRRHLEVGDLLELHEILGKDALDVDGVAGRFRMETDQIAVSDVEGNVWHTPPTADGLESRVQRLLDFANEIDAGMAPETNFLHPILRAIIVHFWLAYEHPFCDGNGRMARALFYWCMLRQGYESASFLSISGPIDRNPKDYYLAFENTELDEGDLTYFVIHQLDVIQQALDELHAHLKRRAERIQKLSKSVSQFDQLNHRQRSVLLHAIRHPLQGQTIESLANTHSVHYMTARQDLADLEKRGLLVAKNEKPKRYFPAPDLQNIDALGTLRP